MKQRTTFQKLFFIAALAALAVPSGIGTASADPKSNATLVTTAMTQLFAKRDVTAVPRYWSKHYIQHNPTIGNGSAELPGIVKSLPANFRYEPGFVVAQGDLVMIHGRYTGWGPKPMVVVDIFRVKDGKLVEHWDVMQQEVPAANTKSGNAMFSPNE